MERSFTTFHHFKKSDCKFCRTESNKESMFVSGTKPISTPTSDFYGGKRPIHLPLYETATSFYEDNYGVSSQRERQHSSKPNGKSTKLASPKDDRTSPKVLDDVKSAAIALTSLSLSPGHGGRCTSADDLKSRKDWSPINYFIFPPTNTPTEENISPSCYYAPKFPPSVSNTDKLSYASNVLVNNGQIRHKDKHDSSEDNEDTRVNQDPSLFSVDYSSLGKPRSFSHRDCKLERTNPVPIHCKPRSYSFDAVGRASKYISTPDATYYDQQVGYHSAPLSRSTMIQGKLGSSSGDDGFCSSSGSADSLEHAPTKRKLKGRTIFRCMWRGCDKEHTSLPGIILHVRHAHIGPSNAGEEEFYFNDVNIDSSTTSGISSSEESLHHDHCSKTKYRKSITEESLQISDDQGVLQKEKCKMEDQYCLKYERDTMIVKSPELKNSSSNKTVEQNIICDSNLKNLNGGETYKTTTQHSIENLLRHDSQKESTGTARHLNSPSFNMNFSTPFQPANMCRIFLQNDMTTHRRSSGGKGRKKCRKVYGMSNKDLWCTQCRWKKACTRFT